jgi:hypothetical protein
VDERAVRQRALQQLGLITRDQVAEAGGSDRAIHRRLASGGWSRLREGVYVVGAAASSWEQTALGAALAAGPGASLWMRSAARGLGLVDRSGAIQLVIPDRRRVRLPGVVIHRPAHLPPTDLAYVGPLPVTSVVRTLIDLAPSQAALTMGVLVDAAIRDHHVTTEQIATRIVELAGRGRQVPRSLVEALSLRSPGYDPGRSALESRILAVLARAALPPPERQHPVLRSDGQRAFIDLAYPGPKLALEADGWGVHGQRAAFDADRIRANELVLLGWSVLRFTSAMSDARICATVARALDI